MINMKLQPAARASYWFVKCEEKLKMTDDDYFYTFSIYYTGDILYLVGFDEL